MIPETAITIVCGILAIILLYYCARHDTKTQRIPWAMFPAFLIATAPAALLAWSHATLPLIIAITSLLAVLTILAAFNAFGGGDLYLFLCILVAFPHTAILIIILSFIINALLTPAILYNKNKEIAGDADLSLRLTMLASKDPHDGAKAIHWEPYHLPAAVGILYAFVIVQAFTIIPVLI